ncbi:polysaccharide biosynthesis protein [Loigolactobacillus zhaoyuanensis]|uniref:polysaccharide biosynthesis protein n=1 Tax=Loigolactobacillus zhaoyuanensis TaxID=2486017 RepID=UPI000F7448DD|nr:polysaccharide biosynthesis protein [Loigolactobacillus zhaoyuanensis]
MVMKSTNSRVTATGLYLSAFSLFFCYAFFATSMYNDALPPRFELVVLAVVVPLLLTKIVAFDRYSMGQWLIMLTGLVLVAWTARTAGRYVLIGVYLLVIGARQVSFEKIAKTALLVGLATFILIFVSAYVDLIPNLRYLRAGTYRNSFGIQYPTDFAAHVLYLLLTYAAVKKGRFQWFDWLINLFAAWFVWHYCDARLDTVLIGILLVLLAVYWLIQKGIKPALLVSWLSVGAMAIGAALSLGLSYFYSPKIKWLEELNHLLSARLRLGRTAFDRYDLHWFGQVIETTGWGGTLGFKQFTGKLVTKEYFFIDSAYLSVLLSFGLLVALALLVGYTWFAWREVRRRDYLLPLLIAVTAISCIIDQHLLDISYNIFVLALLADTESFRLPESG